MFDLSGRCFIYIRILSLNVAENDISLSPIVVRMLMKAEPRATNASFREPPLFLLALVWSPFLVNINFLFFFSLFQVLSLPSSGYSYEPD